MTYNLEFEDKAKKEWDKLDNPKIPKDRLLGTGNHECYKIKLRNHGYRMVYEVINNRFILLVISVGKRENDEVYVRMRKRLK
jgi:mRNA interferase RelE/StbE